MSAPRRCIVAGVLGVLLPCFLVLSGCSDDPILGPSDGETEGGGSYSAIDRLAKPDPAAEADSIEVVPSSENPERF